MDIIKRHTLSKCILTLFGLGICLFAFEFDTLQAAHKKAASKAATEEESEGTPKEESEEESTEEEVSEIGLSKIKKPTEKEALKFINAFNAIAQKIIKATKKGIVKENVKLAIKIAADVLKKIKAGGGVFDKKIGYGKNIWGKSTSKIWYSPFSKPCSEKLGDALCKFGVAINEVALVQLEKVAEKLEAAMQKAKNQSEMAVALRIVNNDELINMLQSTVKDLLDALRGRLQACVKKDFCNTADKEYRKLLTSEDAANGDSPSDSCRICVQEIVFPAVLGK